MPVDTYTVVDAGIHRCIQRQYPSRDVVGGVWPQPPTTSCPPCIQEFSPTAAELKVVLFEGNPPQDFWDVPGVASWNQAHLELTHDGGQILNLPFSTVNFTSFNSPAPNEVLIANLNSITNLERVVLIREATMDDGAVLAFDTPIRAANP